MEEILDHIGERLSKARECAGLTVDDVIFRTRIPRSVVEALEAGDFSVFSSPTYAKSFLSQYSGFLDVDARLWLDALEPAAFVASEFAGPLWKVVNPAREKPAAEVRGDYSGFVSALTMLVATCGLIFVALKGYQFFDSRFAGESAPDPINEPASSTPVIQASPALPRQEAILQAISPKETSPPNAPPRAVIVR